MVLKSILCCWYVFIDHLIINRPFIPAFTQHFKLLNLLENSESFFWQEQISSQLPQQYIFIINCFYSGLGINHVADTALLLSGGQYSTMKRFCDFMNLGISGKTAFYNNQSRFVSPAVQQEYDKEVEKNLEEIKERPGDLIVCGDCQMDSLGHCATKGW